jgi:PTH1 family peptidyl-tRNA hydrolase
MQRVRQLWNRFSGLRQESVRAPTRLIVGLGNPGPKYAATRHNVGFRIVELLADRHREGLRGGRVEWRNDRALEAKISFVELDREICLLVEPQTFMNRSGKTLLAVFERWPELDPKADLLIVYDDLDLPTGRIRLRPSGGSGGHRGIGDILLELDTKEIPRLRFGVAHPGDAGEVTDWVLEPFSAEEEATVLPASLSRAVDAIEMVIREGVTPAMGQFNSNA